MAAEGEDGDDDAEVGAQVVRTSGAACLALIGELFGQPGGDPAEVTREAFRGAALTLEALDFADPCPIATVALEVASTHELGDRPARGRVHAGPGRPLPEPVLTAATAAAAIVAAAARA